MQSTAPILTKPAVAPRGVVMTTSRTIAFVGAHAALGLAAQFRSEVATAHALLALAAGLVVAMFHKRDAAVMYIVAYLGCSGVFWRMSEAGVFYEFGKYSVSFVLLVAMARRPLPRIGLPLLYFVLLAPSATMTLLQQANPTRDLSLHMSGPLAIACAVAFFSSARVSGKEVISTLFGMTGPTIAVGTISAYAVVTNTSIQFSNDSNTAAAGGFGANQVSSVLGLGALLAFILLFLVRGQPLKWLTYLVLAIFLTTQAVTTFSRGGVVGLLGALAVAGAFMVRRESTRRAVMVSLVALVVVGWFLVLPWLGDRTDGMVFVRYSDSSATGREELALKELQMFWDNPILGAGVGQAWPVRGMLTHTEYTRMLAEHGIFGLGALVALFAMCWGAFRRSGAGLQRAITSGLLVWFGLYLLHAALRLAVPAVVLGVAIALNASIGRRAAVAAPRRRKGEPDESDEEAGAAAAAAPT